MFNSFFKQAGSDEYDGYLIALWASLLIFVGLWISPFVFILFTSLKSNNEVINSSAFSFPEVLNWINYAKAWARGSFDTTFYNSVIISFIKVPLGILISSLAAYALANISFKGSRVIYFLMVFGTMIPFQVMLAPLFHVVNDLGLLNTYAGVILPYLSFGVPYQVFILYSFFKGVPKELTEAAYIDGASNFTIYWKLILPISLPVLSALFILDFVSTWNEFAMALVLLQDSSMWTLPLGLMSFQGQFSSDYGQLNSAIVMTVMPAILVYMIFQRYFVSGLTSGSVKE